MGLLPEDVADILNPDDNKDVSRCLSNASQIWLDWALSELSSGEGILPHDTPKCICYYLRVLNVALSLYSRTADEYLRFNSSVDILTHAFGCWFDDWREVEADFRIICSNRNYFIVYYHPHIDMRKIEMTIKGKRYLRNAVGSIKSPLFEKEHLCNQPIKTTDVQAPVQLQSKSNQKEKIDFPISKKKMKTRKAGPGRTPDYTEEERAEILQAREQSKANGQKREIFIESYALKNEMNPSDVKRWLYAAERQQRPDRKKKPRTN